MRVSATWTPTPRSTVFIMPTQDGDRWLLCSDGLSGVVDDDHTAKTLALGMPPARTATAAEAGARRRRSRQRHRRAGRRGGSAPRLHRHPPTVVGSASNPSGVVVPAARTGRGGWLHHARQVATNPRTSNRPPSPRGAHRRGPSPRAAAPVRMAGGVAHRARRHRVRPVRRLQLDPDALLTWAPTRTRSSSTAAIQQSIGPLTLSTVYEDTDVALTTCRRVRPTDGGDHHLGRFARRRPEHRRSSAPRPGGKRIDRSEAHPLDGCRVHRHGRHARPEEDPRARDAAQPRNSGCSSSRSPSTARRSPSCSSVRREPSRPASFLILAGIRGSWRSSRTSCCA